jgi:hypothetical protein
MIGSHRWFGSAAFEEAVMDRPPEMIAPELDAILRRELMTGERILWSGQPNPNKLYAAFGMWLFAIPWTVFALFWEGMALFMLWGGTTKTPDWVTYTFGFVFPLFGVPFVATGFYMLSMPITAIGKAKRTVFALTDRRMLRVTAGKSREAASVMLDQMGPFTVKAGSDGYGSLSIQTGTSIDSDGDRTTETFLIAGVPDVARLEGLLLDHRSKVQ